MDKCNRSECNNNSCGSCCTRITNFGVTLGKNNILKDINLHIHCGELTAIIGPNGAGKSTLLKAILGEVKHTGELIFCDEKGLRNGRPLIGYVPQSLVFDHDSPISVLDLFTACLSISPAWLLNKNKNKEKVIESLKRVHSEHLIDRRLGALSGGELQRVLLALALDPIPDILLLDEPVSGIDLSGMNLFYNLVSDLRENYDLSIILVSHDLNMVAKYADRIVLINGTILCSGAPEFVVNNHNFKKIFGNLYNVNQWLYPHQNEGGNS